MIMASDPEFTLWPRAGTRLMVDLAGTSFTVPVVGGGGALMRAGEGVRPLNQARRTVPGRPRTGRRVLYDGRV
jgi:hypothetical protein